MPMSYLYGKRIQRPIKPLVLSLRKEIHPIPFKDINWNKQRNNCCKENLYYPHSSLQDVLWHTLHYISEHILKYWPFSKLRGRSLDRVVELMCYESEETRYITIGCVEKSLQMMCWWAENPNGDELKYHFARVPDYLWIAEDGMTMMSFGSQVWDFAFATQAIIASNMTEEYDDCLKKAHFYLRESQIKENPSGDFTRMHRRFTKGAWAFSDQDHGWIVSDCTAESLMCLLLLSNMPKEIVGEKDDNARLYEAMNVLLYLQSPISGGFAVWEPAIPKPFLQLLNPSELFVDIVVEKEHLEPSACIIAALVEFHRVHPSHRKEEIEVSISNGIHYLEETQCLDVLLKSHDNNEAVFKGVKFLHSTQNEEGGWGESRLSCPREVYTPFDGNQTNLVQTSWAMLGLMFSG
uniref:Squalene cyclase C-terminal domain-containing protein n=1 Tax=Lactuca sativa TaxID=4236 RepID=A0A9R1WRB9_LACSA|nr:hypothetical protein LSAT_V11C100030420 [Lactuca sativa]